MWSCWHALLLCSCAVMAQHGLSQDMLELIRATAQNIRVPTPNDEAMAQHGLSQEMLKLIRKTKTEPGDAGTNQDAGTVLMPTPKTKPMLHIPKIIPKKAAMGPMPPEEPPPPGAIKAAMGPRQPEEPPPRGNDQAAMGPRPPAEPPPGTIKQTQSHQEGTIKQTQSHKEGTIKAAQSHQEGTIKAAQSHHQERSKQPRATKRGRPSSPEQAPRTMRGCRTKSCPEPPPGSIVPSRSWPPPHPKAMPKGGETVIPPCPWHYPESSDSSESDDEC